MSAIPHFPVGPAITVSPPPYKVIRRNRSALPTTETELKLMAAAAMIGLLATAINNRDRELTHMVLLLAAGVGSRAR